MWLNTAAYYDSNFEMMNWVPHVLYTLLSGCRDKKNNKLLSLSCDIGLLPEFLSFFAQNLHFLSFFFFFFWKSQ